MSVRSHHFADPDWLATASLNGFSSFPDFWEIPGAQIDAINRGRGGWSGVLRCSLKTAGGGTEIVYIKRQVNYTSRTLRHPLRGVTTVAKEFEGIRFLERFGIATPRVLYYAEEQHDAERRAILITEALTGYESLDRLEAQAPPCAVRRQYICAAAALLKSIHDLGRRHNCFYPNHIFLGQNGSGLHPCIIDLEKMRWMPLRSLASRRDIRALFNRCPKWTRSQRLRFLLAYTGADHVNAQVKRLWRALNRR